MGDNRIDIYIDELKKGVGDIEEASVRKHFGAGLKERDKLSNELQAIKNSLLVNKSFVKAQYSVSRETMEMIGSLGNTEAFTQDIENVLSKNIASEIMKIVGVEVRENKFGEKIHSVEVIAISKSIFRDVLESYINLLPASELENILKQKK